MRSVSKVIGQNVDYSGTSRTSEMWYNVVSVFIAGFFFAFIVGECRLFFF